MNKESRGVLAHIIEFFLVGLVMGIIEDLVAIKFATDATITLDTIKVAFLVALPFGIVSDLLVDGKFFRKMVKKLLNQR